jgi:hypothetical protein
MNWLQYEREKQKERKRKREREREREREIISMEIKILNGGLAAPSPLMEGV